MLKRLRHYPARFLLRHPIRALRNLVGNHPSKLACRYLSGLRGVEIGGSAYNRFFLDTVNVDFEPEPENAAFQRLHAGRVMDVDVVAPADALPFEDDEFDFVLASHVLEHIPDPIKALREWARVARSYVYVILPHPDNPQDRGRPLTTIEELERRHAEGFTSADAFSHWNVWSSDSFVALSRHLALRVLEVQDPDDKRGNGFAVVLSAEGRGRQTAHP